MMTIDWRTTDEPGHPPPHDIARNCGQLIGRLDQLLPCLYIAQYCSSVPLIYQRTTDPATGLFCIGARKGGDGSFVERYRGVVLPVDLCRDEKARAALLEIPALVDGTTGASMSDRRKAVQGRLDDAFGGALQVARNESLDGFFALAPNAHLFQRLHDSFDQVTDVVDGADGVVRMTGTTAFRWRSYGELMEWYNGHDERNRFGHWLALTPFFVCGNTEAVHLYQAVRSERNVPNKPAEEPARWFVLRPGLQDARFGIRFEMEENGWAKLHLSLDDATLVIQLDDVFDPFPGLLAWGREIAEGDLPVEVDVEEDAQVTMLTVLRTDDPRRVLLRVRREHEMTPLLEGIVPRIGLAAALKDELFRFFTTEFDPQHWDMERDEKPVEDYVSVKDVVLGSPWLASSS